MAPLYLGSQGNIYADAVLFLGLFIWKLPVYQE